MIKSCPDILNYTLTDHAQQEMARRNISQHDLDEILQNPEQRELVRNGRCVYQSRLELNGKLYLLRVFVDVDRLPPEIVTV